MGGEVVVVDVRREGVIPGPGGAVQGIIRAGDPSALAYSVRQSCENKAEVVSLDEKESGLTAALNLGHTFGQVDKKVADGLLRLILLKGPLGLRRGGPTAAKNPSPRQKE
ncbi:hypothetical protein NE237_017086 [Protea cynaroides]|uniref:3-dehydroquinate synthase C-terminal domain-containing protein n=1 Tax=Protea cynaroides TaxID=273540 RepID=A0A9Q0K7D0_9MAGN|nr:hypothetical protein NE237_017086 [Protea cynaroides]